jgi:hypothetical protein
MGGEELSESRRMRRTRGSTDNRAGRLKGRVSCGGPATVQLLRGRVNPLNPRSAFLLLAIHGPAASEFQPLIYPFLV